MGEYKLGTGNKNDNGVLEQGTDERFAKLEEAVDQMHTAYEERFGPKPT